MTGAVAKRYARALAAVASEEGRLESTVEELARVSAWVADPQLATALAAPTLAGAPRRALIGQMTQSLGLATLTSNFLSLLAERNRLGELAAIAHAYGAMVDRALDRVRARIRVAAPLAAETLAEVSEVLERICGKSVIATVETDPDLIGGLTIEIEGRVYDGSVRTQLEHLARTLSRATPPG